MTAPYLIVGLCGDSNGMWGKYLLEDGTDDAGTRIFAYKETGVIVAADEPLADPGGTNRMNLGYSAADGEAGQVGSTVALCRLLRDEGHLPNGYDILIVPTCWAGTAFLNFWAVTGNRKALDGQAPNLGFLERMTDALATHADNLVWFYDWNHGANDGGQSETQYRNNMIATWDEIRDTCGNAPLLVTGMPPNYVNPALGGSVSHNGVIAAQQNIADNIADCIYVSPAGLTAIDTTNDYIHFCAAIHRGGTNNAPGNTSEVVTVANSLAGRKRDALLSLKWRMRATWS